MFVVKNKTANSLVLSNEVIDKDYVQNWLDYWDPDFSRVSALTIEPTCKKIESGAFENFIGLSNVTIPSTVESVGRSTFYGCDNLTLKFANRTWEEMASMSGYPFGLPITKLRATTAKPSVDSPLKLGADVLGFDIAEEGKVFAKASECAVLDGIAEEILTKDDIDQRLQNIALNRNTSFKVIACLSSSTTRLGNEAFAGLSNLYYVDFVDNLNNITKIEKKV